MGPHKLFALGWRCVLVLATSLLLACSAGSSAPDSSFVLLNGKRLTTANLRGQVVLVNFWATSCPTCVAEMPQLIATHRQFEKRGLQTLAVAMQYDPPSYVLRFTQTRQLPFQVVLDNTGAIAQAWNVQLTPTTFVLNRRLQIVKRFVGEPDFAALNALIAQLLEESA